MNNIEAMKLALEALEIVTREMLALRDELAERGGRPKKGIRQLLWDSSHKVYTDTAIPAAEALRQAIEQAQLVQRAEDAFERYEAKSDKCLMENAQGDLERVKLVQTGVGIGEPEFTTHAVENAYDWSEWVCPDPKGYLMKCCDCGLVHEAEFKVVRYKSEAEREDCEPVDDINVQAVFRMRRSEQWSPIDTAHRAGGLPMEQAEQAQPVGEVLNERGDVDWISFVPSAGTHLYTAPPPRQPLTDERIESVRHMRNVQGYDGNWNYDPYMQGLYNGLEFALSLLEVRQPEFKNAPATWLGDIKFKRDKLSSEAAHGIKGEA